MEPSLVDKPVTPAPAAVQAPVKTIAADPLETIGLPNDGPPKPDSRGPGTGGGVGSGAGAGLGAGTGGGIGHIAEYRGSAIRARVCCSSVSPPRRTAPTARDACSPATARATS